MTFVSTCPKCGNEKKEVFCRFITRRNGEVVYPVNAQFFHFYICEHCKGAK